MAEPDNLVLSLLCEMRGEMNDIRTDIKDIRATMATKSEFNRGLADIRSEMKSGFADVASDVVDLEKKLSEQIVGLRRSVMEYHSSAVGHGILMSEFEERLRRVEQHLNLPASEAH